MARYEQALQAYKLGLGRSGSSNGRPTRPCGRRVGIVLAELGRAPEAISYHQRAIALARQRALPQLEGEQLTMLALAYRDQHDWEQARSCCQDAINVFSTNDLETEASRARQLLAEMSAP